MAVWVVWQGVEDKTKCSVDRFFEGIDSIFDSEEKAIKCIRDNLANGVKLYAVDGYLSEVPGEEFIKEHRDMVVFYENESSKAYFYYEKYEIK